MIPKASTSYSPHSRPISRKAGRGGRNRVSISLGAFLLAYCFTPIGTSANARQLDMAGADALVVEALKQWQVPGAAVVVVERGRIMYLKGHGVRELGRPEPVTPDTLFPLASCTKAFTSTLTAMLADDGKLNWDDPVRKHLPDFRLSDPLASDGVTLRDLLCHRTGLASHDELWYGSPWPVAEQVRRAGLLALAHPFRTTFHYQSVMYSAAGLASARVSGTPWDDLVRKRIFEPLGMRGAICTSKGEQRATPHRIDRDGKLVPIPWYEQPEPNPAGSIHLTARDLASWLLFQLGDGTWQGKRLISDKNFAETHMPQIVQRLEGVTAATNPETTMMSYGLGWVVQDYRGTLVWAHTGIIDGFRAQIAIAPKAGYAVAVLSNRHETRMNLALVNAMIDRLIGPVTRDWNEYLKRVVAREEEVVREAKANRERIRRQSSMPRPMPEYVGAYEHPAYGECVVKLAEGEGLQWRWLNRRAPMIWDQADQFHLELQGLREPPAIFEIIDGHASALQLFGVTFAKKR
jgi:CubicO group peptidase (beta-lactamase class C family)